MEFSSPGGVCYWYANAGATPLGGAFGKRRYSAFLYNLQSTALLHCNSRHFSLEE
jgi:hypothetical protein